jgi:hypothetical protein
MVCELDDAERHIVYQHLSKSIPVILRGDILKANKNQIAEALLRHAGTWTDEMGVYHYKNKGATMKNYTDELEEQIETMKKTALQNSRFLLIALNLSGKKEALECEAERLIEEHGFICALKISNKEQQ